MLNFEWTNIRGGAATGPRRPADQYEYIFVTIRIIRHQHLLHQDTKHNSQPMAPFTDMFNIDTYMDR